LSGARDLTATPSNKIFSTLTDRERRIVQLICEGLSNKAIGRRIKLSESRVKVHVHDIYQKLAIRNRATLAAMARRSPK
jgi:two-component system, NarL family, nitrate/nitrite response regulator NarL